MYDPAIARLDARLAALYRFRRRLNQQAAHYLYGAPLPIRTAWGVHKPRTRRR